MNILSKDNIRGIQIVDEECRITVKNKAAKQQLKKQKLNINNRIISVSDADKNITNVTIKGSPLEMEDSVITSALGQYGNVVQGSLVRGTIKDTYIKNGTGYLDIENAVEDIPVETQIGSFNSKVYCNNGRAKCKVCNNNNHPYFKCPMKPQRVRRCFRCQSENHEQQNCPNEVSCHYCGQSGHTRHECDDWKEKRERDKYGVYWPEIKDGRKEDDVFTGSEPEKLYHKDNQINRVTER